MRGIQGAMIVASTLQIVIGFSGLWRNITRLCIDCTKLVQERSCNDKLKIRNWDISSNKVHFHSKSQVSESPFDSSIGSSNGIRAVRIRLSSGNINVDHSNN